MYQRIKRMISRTNDRPSYVDRNVIVVRPKRPFAEWINRITGESKPLAVRRATGTAYFVPEMPDTQALNELVKRYHAFIFADQLSYWTHDEAKIPAARSFNLFKEWFEVEYCLTAVDMVDEPIRREPFEYER